MEKNEEVKEEKTKNSNGLIVTLLMIIVVLLIIVIFLLTPFVKDIEQNGKKDPDVIENNNKNNKKEVEIDSSKVTDAIKSYNTIFIPSDALYKKSTYSAKDLTDEQVIGTVLNSLFNDSKVVSECVFAERPVVSVDEVNKEISKYILNKKLNIDDIKKVVEKNSMINRIRIEIISGGLVLYGPCDGSFQSKYIDKKLVKAEEDENYLYVYEKHVFAQATTYEDVNLYKNYDRTELVEENKKTTHMTLDGKPLPNSEPNWDLYNTYKYTFKNVNGTYYFESFALDK